MTFYSPTFSSGRRCRNEPMSPIRDPHQEHFVLYGKGMNHMVTTEPSGRADAFTQAVAAAILAPSVHNTQPWQFELTRLGLDILADPRRQLTVLDPTSRQQHISVGCALFNARVALAAAGCPIIVDRLPDPDHPQLLARITMDEGRVAESGIARLESELVRRQTNRRRFTNLEVPDRLVQALAVSADAEYATLTPITDPTDQAGIAQLWQEADRQQIANPAYRAELRAWTTSNPERRDGVSARVVPHVDADPGDNVPIRDFDSEGVGWLPTQTCSTTAQCLLMLSTSSDGPLAWLRAGEALERVWLEITCAGFVASLFTQAIELATFRPQVRKRLRLSTYPHLMLRVGRAPLTASTSRRAMSEMLREL
jgi:hypothetical protein